jgi:uncharacterized repeat protein (TIGR02543 family)
VIFGLVRKKADSARHKIVSIVVTTLISGVLVSIPVPAQAAACSTTETTASNGDTILTFSTVGSCDWEVPSGVTSVRVLVVGGGGSGGGGISGSWFGAGGGGGEVIDNQSFVVTSGAAISVTVGAGGIKSNYSTTYTGAAFDLRSGTSSAFGSITADGGKSAINSTAAGGVSGSAKAGGTGAGGTWGNGGAGAAAAGSAQNAGAGITSDISGSSLEYGGGGNGNNGGTLGTPRDGAGSSNVAAAANRGGGGANMPSDSYNGGAGGSGVVIVRYAVAPACNPTETTASNGDTVLTFSTVGRCDWEVPSGVGVMRTLVVAGGGAGGGGYTANYFGNGGGGGEVIDSPSIATPGEDVPIFVGAGGTATNYNTNSTSVNNGQNSSFGSIIARGGSSTFNRTTRVGGSSGNLNTGGTGTNAAGGATEGGGGAGSGANGSGRNGGAGTTSLISGTATQYGGGGASMGFVSNPVYGTATGGGGVPATYNTNVKGNGTANTGGGGGGDNGVAGGGAGGSGVVILRYSTATASNSPTCAANVGFGGVAGVSTNQAGHGCVIIAYTVSGSTTYQTFNYTGQDQSWTSPASTTDLTFYLVGAGGGAMNAAGRGSGAAGGFATGTYSASSATVLKIIVGQGGNGTEHTLDTYGGGGKADYGSGGGRSAIRVGTATEDLITAGGGGGGGYDAKCGGAGGGTTGQDAVIRTSNGEHGKGATQTAGGVGGYSTNNRTGGTGVKYQGGLGRDESGGGGGGYWGGGGGGDNIGAGGGSGYFNPSLVTDAQLVQGTCNAPGSSSALAYGITYNGNGNTSGTAPAGQAVRAFSVATLASNAGNLAKTGFTFAGWNTAANGSGSNYAVGTSVSPSRGITLYAQWNSTITFNGNGQTSAPATVPAAVLTTSDASRTFLLNVGTSLLKTGLSFSGWNTAADGSGTNYAGGASYTSTGNATLYAIFRPTITYNANGASSGTVPASTLGPVPGTTCTVDPGYTNCKIFTYTGSDQTFTVPSDIDATKGIRVEAWGAGGGGSIAYYGDPGGGAGGYSKVTLTTPTSGEVLKVVVGQGGLVRDQTVQYGGGGVGGLGGEVGSSGGGYSGIFTGTTPLIISGGGGGTSPGSGANGTPGGGGGANQNGGQAGTAGAAGRGGTNSAGGAGATGNASCPTTGSLSPNGSSLLGGASCNQANAEGGGGGGGGYYGGGGGTYQTAGGGPENGGGGGGSGYLDATRGTLITALAGGNGVLSNFSYPDRSSTNYADNAGRGGKAYTNTTADNSGGNGLITIQWSSPSATNVVASNTGNLARVGYSFAGWNTAADGSGTSVSAGSPFNTPTSTTLYASWALSNTGLTPNFKTNTSTPIVVLKSTAYTINNEYTGTDNDLILSQYADKIQIIASVPSGTLKITNTGNITLPIGYQSTLITAAATISFIGDLAAVNAALATMVYTVPATAVSTTITITASYAGINGNYRYNPATGSTYYRNPTTAVWANTYNPTAAASNCGVSFNGMCGYMAVPNTVAESTFIGGMLGTGWIGVIKSSGLKYIDNAPSAIAGTTVSVTNWSAGEGSLAGENYVGIEATTGKWADLSTQSYNPIYEFGGKSETQIFAALTRTIEIAPAVTVTYLANTGTGTVPTPLSGVAGNTLRAAENTGNLQKAGLTFAGWNTKADGTGATYLPGASFTTSTSISLHAMYLAACTPTQTKANGFVVLTFTGAGNCLWTTPAGVSTIDLLTVGGGGGGGSNLGGGGGGGRVLYQTSVTSIGTAVITVGAGGTGGAGNYDASTNHGKTGVRSGFVSSSLEQIALGGSGGNGRMSATNLNPDGTAISTGWTGGGGAYANPPAEIAIAGVGGDSFIGGMGSGAGGGGGGGAGGVGTASNAGSNAGAGGIGATNSITGTSTYYGGGGGASRYGGSAAWTGVGGLGGGGNAIAAGAGVAGTANTGGGGSGGYSAVGGAGGTGIVILRYSFGTPSAPTITSITGSANKLTVAFTPPASDGGSAITNYEYSLNGGVTWTALSPADATSPIEITKLADGSTLANGSTYQVAIRALNGKTGLASNTVAGTTPLSAPTISAAIGNGSSTVTVAPAAGESPTSFTVTALTNLGVALSPPKTCTVTAPATTCVVTGLTNGATYKFSAVANLGSQVSPAATTATGITPVAPVVTYNANNGTVGPSNTATLDIAFNAGTPVVHPLPVRSGYNFTGWYNASNALIGQNGSNYEPAATITLTAGWVGVTYSISYNGNGNTAGTVPATGSYINGSVSPYSILGNTGSLAKTGYTFAGWVDGTGATKSGNYSTAADLQLFASWTALEFTVSFDSASGSLSPANQLYTYGAAGITLPSAGTRVGYTFLGWSRTATGTTVSSPFIADATMTLYARWAGSTFSVAFNSNGGSNSPATASFTTGYAGITLPSAGTLSGYNFDGWSETLNGTVITGAYSTSVDITLYAKWSAISYNITYNRGSIGGTPLTSLPATFPSNTTSTVSTVINLDNTISSSVDISGTTYVFTGWKESVTNSVYKGNDPYRMSAAPVTFTAQWVAVYTVSYVLNGGSGAVPPNENRFDTYEETLTNVVPEKAGFIFTGWKDQAGNLVSAHPVPADTKFIVGATRYLLYAQWTPEVYTITYLPGAAGATGAVTATTGNYRENVTLGLNTPLEYTNYKFVGWKIGTTIYSAGGNYVLSANVNAEAQWESTLSQIFYDINGGIGSAAPSVANQGVAVTLPFVGTFSRAGYALAGWIGGGVTTPAATFTNSTTNSVTLIAQWTLLTPAIPLAPTAVAGSGSATITVNPGAGGGPADSYVVTALDSSGVPLNPSKSCTVYTPSTSCVIQGLTDGTAYKFSSNATNSAGTAVSSPASTAVTPAGKPSVVNGVSATATNAAAAVRFNPPATTGGAPIASYTVTASTGQTCLLLPTFPDPLVCNVTGLTNGTAVTFTVSANNGAYTSDSSTASIAVTPATVPGAPTAVTATSTTSGKATVTFTAPVDNGGSAITEYLVTSAPGGFTCVTSDPAAGCEVSGLTNGIAYTFTVIAKNAPGNSLPSLASSAVTPVGKPAIPTNIVASAGNASATVSFTAPNNGGSAITRYDVEAYDQNGVPISPALTCTFNVPFPTPLACTFANTLNNGLQYTFKVSATNVVGTSDSSTATSVITPANLIATTLDQILTPIGETFVGELLTASAQFGGFPTPTVTYVWERCTTSAATSCTTIAGATADAYTTTSADIGSFIRYKATGVNTGRTVIGTSAVTDKITGNPVLTAPTSGLSAETGTAFSLAVAATGGAEPFTFAITAGTLPTGLTIDSTTGSISGTPTAAGTSTITVLVADDKGKTATASFTITVTTVSTITEPEPTCNAACIAAEAEAERIARERAAERAAEKVRADATATAASNKASADAAAAAAAARAAIDKATAAALAKAAADAAAKTAAAQAKAAADAQAAADRAAAAAAAALKSSTTSAAAKAAATKSANNAAAAAAAAVKAAATAATNAAKAESTAANATKQVDIAINSLNSKTAASQSSAQANAIAAAAKAAANEAAAAAALKATEAKAAATAAQKAATETAARIASEQREAAAAAAAAKAAADAAALATAEKIAATTAAQIAAENFVKILNEKAALADQAAKATTETARAEINKKIEEITIKVIEAQKITEEATNKADDAIEAQLEATDAAEEAFDAAETQAAEAVAVKTESSVKNAAATRAVTAATVAAKVAIAAKAAAAKVPAKAVIATKPSTSKNKNSATATVTGLKPGQKVKVTVNVKGK